MTPINCPRYHDPTNLTFGPDKLCVRCKYSEADDIEKEMLQLIYGEDLT